MVVVTSVFTFVLSGFVVVVVDVTVPVSTSGIGVFLQIHFESVWEQVFVNIPEAPHFVTQAAMASVQELQV